ncbi:MAG: trehalose-6-phosphate synthase [Candidatus Latescibacterota bacterium]|nr:MAG: trehalose-6-phosphate synthase [Candidatus Latescibacterota bacterium]
MWSPKTEQHESEQEDSTATLEDIEDTQQVASPVDEQAIARISEARTRLEEFASSELGDAHLVVVSNREPYVHTDPQDGSKWHTPASGLTTALDPVMRICGGTWVAHGSGHGDILVADASGRVQVPPDHPQFTLRRVWLERAEVAGYYDGFSNRTLWPLCHQVYVRPRFEEEDWLQYKRVNEKFAQAILAQVEGKRAIVLVQDYHLALVPEMIKSARPDVVVSQFWHIPWPNIDVLSTCPWHRQILKGLLGNDILGFHVRQYCRNFLGGVDRALEARVLGDKSAIFWNGRTTFVRPYPISIDPETMIPSENATVPELQRHKISGARVLLGIDRLDYIKGIPEKFRAYDRLLREHPEHQGRVVLVQLATPTRSRVPEYVKLAHEVEELAREINERHGDSTWKPIVLLQRLLDQEELAALYAQSDVCVVGSLQDGMNLVAKEFVAARRDQRGVLVLSRFAGATKQMIGALPIHPYDREAYAATLHAAIMMPPEEQEDRMRQLRADLSRHTIYSWAENILREAVQVQRKFS